MIQFQALAESCNGNGLAADPNIRLICLFDNEEVMFRYKDFG